MDSLLVRLLILRCSWWRTASIALDSVSAEIPRSCLVARYRRSNESTRERERERGCNGVLEAIEGWQLIELNYRSTIGRRADPLLHAVR